MKLIRDAFFASLHRKTGPQWLFYFDRHAINIPQDHRREITMQFPSEESGPITGRSIVGAHHQGNRLAEELHINHPERGQLAETISSKPNFTSITEHARNRRVSTRWMWEQRNQLFASVNRKILTILTSHLDSDEKSVRIADIYRIEVKKNLIHLRVRTYEDIFECLLSAPPKYIKGNEAHNRESMLTLRRHIYVDLIFDMFHFMKAGFSAPTPKILEYLMFSISYTMRTNPHLSPELMESRAHKLWLDADKYTITPSRFTYTYYFEVCTQKNCMHIALSRYIDAKERLGIQPDEAMCTTIIRGFVRNNQVEEAVGFISTMYAVPVDCFLLDAVIECFSQSTDPLAAFSVFRSQLSRSGIHPTSFTFHYLMKACEKSGDFSETTFVLRQMMDRSIQGTPTTLNLILKGLLSLKKLSLAQKLYARMRGKDVQVWKELEMNFPKNLISSGNRVKKSVSEKDTRKTDSSTLERDYKQLTQWREDSPTNESSEKQLPVNSYQTKSTVVFPMRPLNDEHLRSFVNLGRLQWVDMEFLCEFLLMKKIQLISKKGPKSITAKRLTHFCQGSPGLRRKVYRLVREYFYPVTREKKVLSAESEDEQKRFKFQNQKEANVHKIAVIGVS